MAKNKLTDLEYIMSHIKFDKNIMGWWEASFTFADGYQMTIADGGASKSIKAELKGRLIDRVLRAKHPIQ